jgi:hypothetical protein
MATPGVVKVPQTVSVTVARGRSVLTHAGTNGPGSTLDLAPDEAATLADQGFVTFTGQDVEEPRTISVEDASPDRIGLQTGVLPSWEEDLAAFRRGAP